VRTPLLSEPLGGSVYAVQPEGAGSPELWAVVSGAGVRLTLRSATLAPQGKPLRADFLELPDLPMSVFTLQLRGGRQGVLTVPSLCSRGRPRHLVAHGAMRGQNDARASQVVRVRARTHCGR
jgi:hypothetical protein